MSGDSILSWHRNPFPCDSKAPRDTRLPTQAPSVSLRVTPHCPSHPFCKRAMELPGHVSQGLQSEVKMPHLDYCKRKSLWTWIPCEQESPSVAPVAGFFNILNITNIHLPGHCFKPINIQRAKLLALTPQ
jgi:hypothetical protein